MRIAIAHAVSQLRQTYPPGPPQPFAKAIIGLLAGTLLLAVLFFSLERLFPEQAGQTFIRKGTKVDALYWFFDFFVSKRLATAASIVVLIAAVALRMPRLSLLARQPLWLQALEAILVAEFCGYWSHRLMHETPLLWRLHKVHHSSERLDWLAAARFHPLESVWNKLITLLPLFLLGFSPQITVFFGPLIAIYPIFSSCTPTCAGPTVGWATWSPVPHSTAGITQPIATRSTRITEDCCPSSISSSERRTFLDTNPRATAWPMNTCQPVSSAS